MAAWSSARPCARRPAPPKHCREMLPHLACIWTVVTLGPGTRTPRKVATELAVEAIKTQQKISALGFEMQKLAEGIGSIAGAAVDAAEDASKRGVECAVEHEAKTPNHRITISVSTPKPTPPAPPPPTPPQVKANCF